MKLSAPLYVLRGKARALKKTKGLKMTEALDLIAKEEGYSSWSLMQRKAEELIPRKKEDIFPYLNPGDLMLIGSRPGLGKTTFTLQILLQAVAEERRCFFFSLEYTYKDVLSKLADLDASIGDQHPLLTFDFSDQISSQYLISRLATEVPKGSVVAIDYLQVLDHQRSKPSLQNQVEELKSFAKERGLILIFISQIDRSFEDSGKERPDLSDVRLPNPLDLSLFNKSLFLHNGEKVFKTPKEFKID